VLVSNNFGEGRGRLVKALLTGPMKKGFSISEDKGGGRQGSTLQITDNRININQEGGKYCAG